MTQLERQIRWARRRLAINYGLQAGCVWFTVAALGYAAIVLLQRLWDAELPLLWIGCGLAAAALVAMLVQAITGRADEATAAARLDELAGLRERLSSGHYCRTAEDPFAQAVVADAERISSGLSARQHVKLQVPRALPWTTCSVLLAAMMFLITPGLLKSTDAKEADREQQERVVTEAAVKRQFDAIRQTVEAAPALEELKAELKLVDPKTGGLMQSPDDIRHEAAKKIDSLSDLVKQKQERTQFGAAEEMRKMLRGLKSPANSESETDKLRQSLAEGDFKTAQEQIRTLQEQLATLKKEQDRELVEKMSKQLEELAKKIEELAEDGKLAEKLEQAGVDPEQAKRMLEQLAKKDLEQIKEALEQQGLSEEQAEKLAKQLAQKQQAGSMAKQLAQKMKTAGQAASAGQMGESIEALSGAGKQLGEAEQLSQEMLQLQAAADALQQAQSELDKPCPDCDGTGRRGGKRCSSCRGGGGMGPKGEGRGGLAPESQANMGFKIERGKVHTQKGAIIGQFLVEGQQVKGEVATGAAEVVTAAEREASDRINRDRIPRHYHQAIKEYFSSVRRAEPGVAARTAPERTDTSGDPADAVGPAQAPPQNPD